MARMTPALADAILDEVAETGDIYRVVCERHGVTKNAFFMWVLRYGSEEQKAKQKKNAEARVGLMEELMIEACSDLDSDDLDKDTETARVNRVRAIDFALNRVAPKPTKTEISGKDGGPILSQSLPDMASMSQEELTLYLKMAEKAHGSVPSP